MDCWANRFVSQMLAAAAVQFGFLHIHSLQTKQVRSKMRSILRCLHYFMQRNKRERYVIEKRKNQIVTRHVIFLFFIFLVNLAHFYQNK